MAKNAKCRLCQQPGDLCNSHIVPEFFYKQMQLYDQNHRFNVLSTAADTAATKEQKGIRERLLCKGCEGKLSQWEDYARRVLYGGQSIQVTHSESGVECCVDYAKFKLFQLSILWRVGISTRDGFSSVTLGEHQEILRDMILQESPGNTETYGCITYNSTQHPEITSNMIHCMGMLEVNGIACVQLLLGGLFWAFFLAEKAIAPGQKELFLQQSGHFRVPTLSTDPGGYILRLALDIHKANPGLFNDQGDAGRP